MQSIEKKTYEKVNIRNDRNLKLETNPSDRDELVSTMDTIL